MMAAAAMELSDVTVILNTLRLWKHASARVERNKTFD